MSAATKLGVGGYPTRGYRVESITPAALQLATTLDAAPFTQDHAIDPAALQLATTLDAAPFTQDHAIDPAALQLATTIANVTVSIVTGNDEITPASLQLVTTLAQPNLTQNHALTFDALRCNLTVAGCLVSGALDVVTQLATYLINNVLDRVRDSVGDQNETRPYITYQVIGGDSLQHAGGRSGRGELTVQITVYADDPITARDTAEQVRVAIDRLDKNGDIDHVFAGSPVSDYEPPADGSDYGLYKHIRDYQIWHSEA